MDLFTIGVFNSTEDEFFNKLIENNINIFCDIRQRRAVRGAKYSFVNSNKLQKKLEELGIKYFYFKELAPTTEIREIQKTADIKNKILKVQRQELGKIFIDEFNNQILKSYDFNEFSKVINPSRDSRVALFCVEEKANACHRSLVAKKFTELYQLESVLNL